MGLKIDEKVNVVVEITQEIINVSPNFTKSRLSIYRTVTTTAHIINTAKCVIKKLVTIVANVPILRNSELDVDLPSLLETDDERLRLRIYLDFMNVKSHSIMIFTINIELNTNINK